MEIISGLSNWKLTIKREQDHIEILRAVTCDTKAALPDELWGLPVTILGDHALAYNAAPGPKPTAPGVIPAICELQITCGPEGEWDNRKLQDLTFPKHLTDVKDYAMYGCKELKTLRFHDQVDRWGGGCLMNCRSLDTFYITRVGEHQGEALAFLCDEIHKELFVTITETDGRVYQVIFPEYVEDFEENIAAHHFEYSIYGGGHPYHHIFKAKQLIFRDYDMIWEKYLKEDHDADGAMRLAWTRLRWPMDLSEKAELHYLQYLKEYKEKTMFYLLDQRDIQGLELYLEKVQPEEALIHMACDRAREQRYTEALAILLERQHKEEFTGFDKDFDL